MYDKNLNTPEVFYNKDFIGVWDNVIKDDFCNFIIKKLDEYLEWYPFLKNFNYHSTTCLLQKTKPTEGYHDWHSESNNIACANRTLVWSVYFNDLKDSGETEFLYQKQKVKPKAGRILIFPGSFTHLHRGNPPYEAKYIATGWLASNDQSNILL